MNTATVTVISDTATKSLSDLHDKLAPGKRLPLMKVLGRRAEGIYRDHFMARDADSPNKQGFPRQHFWAMIRLATAQDTSRTTDDTATVVIANRAINAKLHGGTWGARESKYLAIPATAATYGTRPKSNFIDGLFFLPRKNKSPGGALATRDGGGALTIHWWLVPKVTVAPDPRALPPQDTTAAALLTTARSYILRNT